MQAPRSKIDFGDNMTKFAAFFGFILFGFACQGPLDSSGLNNGKISENAFASIVKPSEWDDVSQEETYYVPAVLGSHRRYAYLYNIGVHPGGGILAVLEQQARETRLESVANNGVKLKVITDDQQIELKEDDDLHVQILAEMVKVLLDRADLSKNDAVAFFNSYLSGVTPEDLKSMINEPDSWIETCVLENSQPKCFIEKSEANKKFVLSPVLKKMIY